MINKKNNKKITNIIIKNNNYIVKIVIKKYC